MKNNPGKSLLVVIILILVTCVGYSIYYYHNKDQSVSNVSALTREYTNNEAELSFKYPAPFKAVEEKNLKDSLSGNKIDIVNFVNESNVNGPLFTVRIYPATSTPIDLAHLSYLKNIQLECSPNLNQEKDALITIANIPVLKFEGKTQGVSVMGAISPPVTESCYFLKSKQNHFMIIDTSDDGSRKDFNYKLINDTIIGIIATMK